jgi:mRNA interferase RelE/StbE
MTFQVLLHPKAVEFLKKLDPSLKEMIKAKISSLKENPELGKPLKYSNFWSLRIEDYRAIYEIDKRSERVIVLFIGHREHVYDDFSKLF